MMSLRVKYTGIAAALLLVGIAFAMTPQSTELVDLQTCFSKESPTFPSEPCLKKTVRELLESNTTAGIMTYIVASSSPSVIRAGCHPIAHIVGEETLIRSGSLENALYQCPPLCSRGCIHGATTAIIARELGGTYLDEDLAHANAATIEKIGAKYCAKDSSLCHGIGHLVYMSNEDLFGSLGMCDKIATNDSLVPCYRGVFMEGSGSAGAFGKKSTTSTETDYRFPCGSVSKKYQHACFLYLRDYQNRIFQTAGIPPEERFAILRRTCETFTGTARSECFFGLGWKLELRIANVTNAAAHCSELEAADAETCTIGLSFAYGEFDQYDIGLVFCNSIAEKERAAACYNALFQRAESRGIVLGIVNSCRKNADTKCVDGYVNYERVKTTVPDYRYTISDLED